MRAALAADDDDALAEAYCNMALADVQLMEYDSAIAKVTLVGQLTDNQVELLMADVVQMRICQRRAANKEFYDFMQQARMRMRRIDEERHRLPARLRHRLAIAEVQFANVSADYFSNVGLARAADMALRIADSLQMSIVDTAAYLSTLRTMATVGSSSPLPQPQHGQQDYERLVACLLIAQQHGYTYFEASAMQCLATLLLDASVRECVLAANRHAIGLLNPEGLDDWLLPGWLAEQSLALFMAYGAPYETAVAWRTLAQWHVELSEYQAALDCLHAALEVSGVAQSPGLVATIREQMCVAYSGLDDKQLSDYNRNIYLDLQEQTRQDRYYEARAQMYQRESAQLNFMMAAVAAAIALLLLLLWLFSRLQRRNADAGRIEHLLQPLRQWQEQSEREAREADEQAEAIGERLAAMRSRLRQSEWRSAENRAKVSLANSATPLIDRMARELHILATREEPDDVRQSRYDYIGELSGKIAESNDVLTQWIQMRQGMLSLHIETFALQPLFDLVAKSRPVFEAKGVTLVVDDTPLWVKADRILTLFMVNTLADNARKFTPSGGTVVISAMDGGDHVDISVTDNGIGISAERLPNIFSYKLGSDHGFGLVNCRGIMEQYRKVSHIFSSCAISAESREGSGSRFWFRLPKGVRRAMMLALVMALPGAAFAAPLEGEDSRQSCLSRASAYADSAYFSNIAGTYELTLLFADSCRECLNQHYVELRPDGDAPLLALGTGDEVLPELRWLADSVPINYNIILDMRNESAVAALALHQWRLYEYNNTVYTQLFKALSADHTLADYCRAMQQSQSNKTIAVVLLVAALLGILPAYYLLYYRHRLHYRLCVDRIKTMGDVLLAATPADEKLRLIDALAASPLPSELQAVASQIAGALAEASARSNRQQASINQSADDLRRLEHEDSRLYVANAIFDNSLSALKHETMYFPSRISRLASERDASRQSLGELVDYYRGIHAMLTMQATRQLDRTLPRMTAVPVASILGNEPSTLTLLGNANLLQSMFALLRRQPGCGPISAKAMDGDERYLVFALTIAPMPADRVDTLFEPNRENIPMLLCRQVVRDHSEATGRRRCGIVARPAHGGAEIIITLPRHNMQ